MTSTIEKVKEVIKNNIEDALCGIYNNRIHTGAKTEIIYDEAGVRIEMCRYYGFFEVFGLTDKEFTDIKAFYRGSAMEELAKR